MLLAIDPGANAGWALFNDQGRLVSCGLSVDGDKSGVPALAVPTRVMIERPMLRPKGEKNPNAILLLTLRAGEWGGFCHEQQVEYLLPNDWKGSTDKDVQNARTWSRLDPDEQSIVDAYIRAKKLPLSKQHNVFDAIGIGLHGFNRLKQQLPARRAVSA